MEVLQRNMALPKRVEVSHALVFETKREGDVFRMESLGQFDLFIEALGRGCESNKTRNVPIQQLGEFQWGKVSGISQQHILKS
jgi:hypothetical protein